MQCDTAYSSCRPDRQVCWHCSETLVQCSLSHSTNLGCTCICKDSIQHCVTYDVLSQLHRTCICSQVTAEQPQEITQCSRKASVAVFLFGKAWWLQSTMDWLITAAQSQLRPTARAKPLPCKSWQKFTVSVSILESLPTVVWPQNHSATGRI